MICVDLNKAEIAWKFEHPKRKFPYYASAAVIPEIVIVGGRDKMVHALDPGSGEEIWSFTSRSRFESSPVIVGDKVIVAVSHGVIYILDIKTGEPVWEFNAGAGMVASASFAAGRFVIGSDDGTLYCFGKK